MEDDYQREWRTRLLAQVDGLYAKIEAMQRVISETQTNVHVLVEKNVDIPQIRARVTALEVLSPSFIKGTEVEEKYLSKEKFDAEFSGIKKAFYFLVGTIITGVCGAILKLVTRTLSQ